MRNLIFPPGNLFGSRRAGDGPGRSVAARRRGGPARRNVSCRGLRKIAYIYPGIPAERSPENDTDMPKQTSFKYLVCSGPDRLWGITVDTVGEYSVEPGYTVYPPPSAGHPDDYYFNVDRGRILDNYQLIYITQGRGWYKDTPGGEALEIRAGTMLIIPPYTWHSYCPDHRTGWHEYWIGFRGEHVDDRYNNGFFSRGRIIHPIGLREHIIDQYREALDIALREKTGSQQVLASIANIILSYVIYYDLNDTGRDIVAEKMDRARSIMRENMLAGITPEEVAGRINMSYSWFRKTFKEYTNVSPAHYIMQLRLRKAKLMLLNSSLSVKEIAYELRYEDSAYFSAIFKKYVGCSPSEYRAGCISGSAQGGTPATPCKTTREVPR